MSSDFVNSIAESQRRQAVTKELIERGIPRRVAHVLQRRNGYHYPTASGGEFFFHLTKADDIFKYSDEQLSSLRGIGTEALEAIHNLSKPTQG